MFHQKSTRQDLKKRLVKVGVVALVGVVGSIAVYSAVSKQTQQDMTNLVNLQCSAVDTQTWAAVIQYLNTFDYNRDGRYSFAEVRQALAPGYTDQQYQQIVDFLDVNRNQYLDLDELCTLLSFQGTNSLVSFSAANVQTSYRDSCPYSNDWATQVAVFDLVDTD
jgi:phenylalanine-4-hydroxylase